MIYMIYSGCICREFCGAAFVVSFFTGFSLKHVLTASELMVDTLMGMETQLELFGIVTFRHSIES
jgi:hypothetical protein